MKGYWQSTGPVLQYWYFFGINGGDSYLFPGTEVKIKKIGGFTAKNQGGGINHPLPCTGKRYKNGSGTRGLRAVKSVFDYLNLFVLGPDGLRLEQNAQTRLKNKHAG